MKTVIATALDWCFNYLCVFTHHAGGCWVYNRHWPGRKLAYWAFDNANEYIGASSQAERWAKPE